MNNRFLPVTLKECRQLGWDAPDFVYVCGDAYVDHPSFGHAIISRILEKAGYRIAMLCLPSWQDTADFTRFGRPRLGFLVTGQDQVRLLPAQPYAPIDRVIELMPQAMCEIKNALCSCMSKKQAPAQPEPPQPVPAP